ncbi:MAG TPA: radical SAM protein [Chryseolinea sp.]|nr:radical SAM protein [Chryseolinea sp.]
MPREILVKSVLNKTKRRDPWFLDDYTINPYSACSFNCLFCYIRGSKYGEHMEEKLSIKSNALEVLDKQLKNRARKNQHGIIVLSSATDPYLQIEKDTLLTRKILELILQYRFPVHVITRSNLVVRDFDLLKEINERAILPPDLSSTLRHGAIITFSFSTTDDVIQKIFEPGATSSTQRLEAVKQSVASGFHTGISLMPLLPYISDTPEQLTQMFSIFEGLNVKYIFPASLTLFGTNPSDSKPLMLAAIREHYPGLEAQYLKLYSYGFQPPKWYRDMVDKRAQACCEKFNLKNSIV